MDALTPSRLSPAAHSPPGAAGSGQALAQTIGPSNAVALSNLVTDARAAHQSVIHSLNGAVKYMIECGQFVIRLHASMTMAQIVAETNIPRRTAERYAQLANMGIDPAALADMGEVTARKLLAKPKVTPEAEDENAEDMHDEKPHGRDLFEAIGGGSQMLVEPPVQTDAVAAFIGVWSRATFDQRGHILDWLRWQKVLPDMEAAA